MTDLRTAAQQALEALENEHNSPRGYGYELSVYEARETSAAITALRAALAQQAEPAQDRHGACPTHCCPVHGCKYMHDDCPVVSGAVQPVYPRNNGCESCADEAEPLNLSDRAVQRRLAAQWGYVPAAQAEPVEPVAWVASKDGRVIYDDASTDDVLLRVSGDFEDDEQRIRYAQRIVDKLNAALVAAAEREACAALLEANGMRCGEESLSRLILETNAAAIRARNNT